MKRVLFLNLGLYEYDELISSELIKKGYEVYEFCTDPYATDKFKLLHKFWKNEYLRYISKEQGKLLDELKENKLLYDKIFVIGGVNIQKDTLNELKYLFPNAEFILYLWDDIARNTNYFNIYKAFDKIYSFDKEDCIKYNLEHLPLFFSNEYIYNNQKKTTQLFTSCSEHSDRIKIIDLFCHYCKNNNIKYKFRVVRSKFSFIKNYLLDKLRKRDYVTFKSISREQNANAMKSAFAVLDIEHSSQNGLSMRIFEALASKCKIITTNEKIKEYDFYSPQNIIIYDRNKEIKIPQEFWETPFDEMTVKNIHKYNVSEWITVLGF